MLIVMRWPRDYRRKAAAVVPVERAALGGIRYVCIGRKNTNALRQRAIVPRRVLYHVPRQKTNTTAIDPIVHPHGSDRRLLPPLNNNLHLPKAHHDIVLHHHPAVKRVLLTGAPLVATLRPDDLYHDAGRMCGGRRIFGGRARTAAPHIWHSTASPSICGEQAGAALPEAAGGGGHGVSCLCCVSARSYFFTLTHTSAPKSAQPMAYWVSPESS